MWPYPLGLWQQIEEQVKTPHKIWAIINTQFEGYHQWEKAPESVAFLRNRHRHLFKVRVWIEQHHNDRDKEYFIFKNFVDTVIVNMLNDKDLKRRGKGGASCEMMAEYIYYYVRQENMKRQIKVEVYEDGEVGAFAE